MEYLLQNHLPTMDVPQTMATKSKAKSKVIEIKMRRNDLVFNLQVRVQSLTHETSKRVPTKRVVAAETATATTTTATTTATATAASDSRQLD